MQSNHQIVSYLLSGLVLVVVFGLRFWRMRKSMAVARRLRLEFLWVMPAVMALASAALLVQSPPAGLDWLWLGLIVAVGAALGWVRGRLIHIEVEPHTHRLNMRTSPAAALFLVALFAVRYGARFLLTEAGPAVHAHLALVTDGFVLFATGLFAMSRLEMALRARRLLREARARGVSGVVSDTLRHGSGAGSSSGRPWS